jgi:hypothetical protein
MDRERNLRGTVAKAFCREFYLHPHPRAGHRDSSYFLHSHLVRVSLAACVCTPGVRLPRGINRLAALSCRPMLRSHLFPASRAIILHPHLRKDSGCRSCSIQFERLSMVLLPIFLSSVHGSFIRRYGVVIHGDMSFDGRALPVCVGSV